MAHAVLRSVGMTAFLAAAALAQPQTSIIPQIADGGAWQTTIVITNTLSSGASASLSFYKETSGGATEGWNLPFLEGSTQTLPLPGGATIFLHTMGTDSTTSAGWGQMIATGGVSAYAIFTQRIPGRTDQDGTAPAGASASHLVMPFDNTGGFASTIALVNPTATGETVSVNIQMDSGAISKTSIDIPAQGHAAFPLAQQFPNISGHSGLIEFVGSSSRASFSTFSVIGLRFNPTGGFTTLPVFLSQSGAPIIGGSTGGAK